MYESVQQILKLTCKRGVSSWLSLIFSLSSLRISSSSIVYYDVGGRGRGLWSQGWVDGWWVSVNRPGIVFWLRYEDEVWRYELTRREVWYFFQDQRFNTKKHINVYNVIWTPHSHRSPKNNILFYIFGIKTLALTPKIRCLWFSLLCIEFTNFLIILTASHEFH